MASNPRRNSLSSVSPQVFEAIQTLVREVPGMTDEKAKTALYSVMKEQARQVDARVKAQRGNPLARGRGVAAETLNVVQATQVANEAWIAAMKTLANKTLRLQDLSPEYLQSLVIQTIGHQYEDLLRRERRRFVHGEGSKVRVRARKKAPEDGPSQTTGTGSDALLDEIADSRQVASLREKHATALSAGPADPVAEKVAKIELNKELMAAIQVLQGVDRELFQVVWERYLVVSDPRPTDKSVAAKLGLTDKEVRGRREKALRWLKEALVRGQ
jgi:hypothetical protein